MNAGIPSCRNASTTSPFRSVRPRLDHRVTDLSDHPCACPTCLDLREPFDGRDRLTIPGSRDLNDHNGASEDGSGGRRTLSPAPEPAVEHRRPSSPARVAAPARPA
jgi:hypothetical protein